ncbi:fungal transcriptional regulatory protein [Zymoseptoria tritici IPO323]|uniref:Fungal transcriptional regulatory protein n=1 Tax=Zymoseptoria tritici (strain CBS 115943 / IPO323) TaxID=336722 RepID=F9X6P0_ZYMTI|nr:fungal transcriptional regulatory protein [Zymoseptoria tritici IPO323]EGP88656.1 fungal transcriptional regulatory protein [Zymoseptoria tritici IPO323]
MDDSSGPKRDNHTPSCAVCQRRKVKCSRTYPCTACTKSGLECVFPPPRKRAKRNPTTITASSDVHSPGRTSADGHRSHAGHVKSASVNIKDHASPESCGSTVGTAASATTNTARLVSDGRYVNNHLWSAIAPDQSAGDESPRPSTATDQQSNSVDSHAANARTGSYTSNGEDMTDGRSFVFGGGASHNTSVQPLPPTHIVYLWQTYVTNIDPVMKLSHAPSVQHIVLGQIGRPALGRNEQAMASAVYFISAVSLSDEQCRRDLQDTRANILVKYRHASEVALSAAGFITTTDVLVLQAFVLHLTALRSIGDFQTVWSLLGLAIRVAGTIGLARDGTSFNLAPFETEMRRRLWWALVYFDGRMAEIVGQEGDLMGIDFETGFPANLNDSDLFPTMSRLPEPSRGPTESIYLQARVLSCSVARSLQRIASPQGTWRNLRDANMPVSEKIEVMQRIERRYQEEILGPCDPTVPLQWLSINTARTFATKLRLIARIPVVDLDREWETADGCSENAFILSMDLLQIQLDLWLEPSVQPWRWHWQAHFQWYALVTLLKQIKYPRPGQIQSRAWALIKKAFEVIIPTLELGKRKSLLLDGIHGLLNAAKRHQKESSAPIDQKPIIHAGRYSRHVLPSPPFKPMSGVPGGAYNNSATGYVGSGYAQRPAPAAMNIMPAIEVGRIPTPPNFSGGRNILTPDPVVGIDLDAIDWVEFDRLAAALCQQGVDLT